MIVHETNTAHGKLMISHTYIFGGALPPFVEGWGALALLAPPYAATVVHISFKPAFIYIIKIAVAIK